MCAPSPPPPPDYTAAANAQGQANIEAARAQGRINNPNVHNPYGDQVVTWDGDTPTLTQTLSASQQALLDARNASQLGLSGLALQGTDAARGIIGSPVDFNGAPGSPGSFRPGGPLSLSRSPEALNPNGLPGMPTAFNGPGNLPAMPAASQAIRDRVINAMMSRANTDIGRHQEQVNSDLVARGITPGTEAYAREMDAIGRQRNDAEQQAIIAGGNAADQAYSQDLRTRQQAQGESLDNATLAYNQRMGIRGQAVGEQGQRFGQELSAGNQNFQQQGQARQLAQGEQAQSYAQQAEARRQYITELLARRQIPLNEITALMSGSQVSNPFAVPGYAQNGQVAPAPLFGATQAAGQYGTDMYNAQAGASNSMLNGLFSLGAAALMGPAGAAIPRPSDRRLKSNVVRVGTHPLGIGVYEYDIFGKRERGVMADEVLAVKPEAVLQHPAGFLMVDYGRL